MAVEAALEHPFYVFGQGWSSTSPSRTMNRYQLPCKELKIGDVCISLTHKNSSTAAIPEISTGPIREETLSPSDTTTTAAITTTTTTTISATTIPDTNTTNISTTTTATATIQKIPNLEPICTNQFGDTSHGSGESIGIDDDYRGGDEVEEQNYSTAKDCRGQHSPPTSNSSSDATPSLHRYADKKCLSAK